jgi:hypothetical protein
MTQQEIQERNKEIATMLGWSYNKFMDRWNEDMIHDYAYATELKFHSDWNWLMEAVSFIKKNIKSSSNTKDAKFGELFIDEWEFRVKSYYVRLIQWTKNGWRIPDRDDMELSLLYIIGENCESEKEAIFLIVSDIAKLYNNKEL